MKKKKLNKYKLHHIVGHYGCVIIERTGTDVYGFLLSHDILYQHRVSSTYERGGKIISDLFSFLDECYCY